ncbi:cytochrome-c peroxidase [Hymenobacter humi]|uniref:Cytochrome-c peroxidase n=1 Tax=Hymenobacter humi TaxID=1411620 RepID=A0ABW2U3Y0_9BACT
MTSQLLRLGLLLGLVGCAAPDEPVVVPEPDGPVVAPSAYNLAVPSNFPAPLAQPTDNPLTVEGVALGRQLFYETALSVTSNVACASCHRQQLAFTDGLAKSIGVNGARSTRSAMSLANLLWEPRLTWDGAASTLETQARIPIEKDVEMHQSLAVGVARLQQDARYPPLFRRAFGSSTITEANTLKALAQFERTLISGNSRYDRFRRGNRTALSPFEQQGLVLFTTHPNGTLRGATAATATAATCKPTTPSATTASTPLPPTWAWALSPASPPTAASSGCLRSATLP